MSWTARVRAPRVSVVEFRKLGVRFTAHLLRMRVFAHQRTINQRHSPAPRLADSPSFHCLRSRTASRLGYIPSGGAVSGGSRCVDSEQCRAEEFALDLGVTAEQMQTVSSHRRLLQQIRRLLFYSRSVLRFGLPVSGLSSPSMQSLERGCRGLSERLGVLSSSIA